MPPDVVFALVVAALSFVGLTVAGLTKRPNRVEVDPPPDPPPDQAYSLGDRVLSSVAKEHGLRHEIDVVSGRFGGVDVDIRALPHGAAPASELVFEGVARFVAPLALELEVRARPSAVEQRSPIVSDGFDSRYAIDVLHEDQARALLSGSVARRLEEAFEWGIRPELDDEALRVRLPARYAHDDAAQALNWLVEVGAQLAKRKKKLPRPEVERRVLEAFSSLAADRAGRVDSDTSQIDLALPLEVGALTLQVMRSGERGMQTLFTLELAHPLPHSLCIGLESSRSLMTRMLHPDVQLGIPAFDEKFLIRGDSSDEVKSALGEAARAALADLADRFDSLTIEPERVRAGVLAALDSRGELDARIDAIVRTVQALAPRADGSPYR